MSSKLMTARAVIEAQDATRGVFSAIAGKVKAMSAAFREADGASAMLGRSHARTAAQVGATSRQLSQANAMARQSAGVASAVQQRSAARARMVDAAPAGLMAARAASVGSIARIAAPLASGLAAGKAVSDYAELEAAVGAAGITADASAESIARAQERILRFAPTIGQSAKETAGALNTLVASGLQFETATDALPAVGRTAKASGAAIEDIAGAGIAVLKQFDIKVGNLERAFDIMAYGGKQGAFELKNMAREFPAIGAGAKRMGLAGEAGLATTTAALQVIKEATGSGEEAANRLQNVFDKAFIQETTKNFKKFGVSLEDEFKKAEKVGVDKLTTLVRLTDQVAKGDEFKMSQLFNDSQAMQGIQALVRGWGEVQKIRAKIMSEGAGTVGRDFDKAMAGTKAKLDVFSAQCDRVSIRIGAKLASAMTPALTQANDLLDRLDAADPMRKRTEKEVRETKPGQRYFNSIADAAFGNPENVETRRRVQAEEDEAKAVDKERAEVEARLARTRAKLGPDPAAARAAIERDLARAEPDAPRNREERARDAKRATAARARLADHDTLAEEVRTGEASLSALDAFVARGKAIRAELESLANIQTGLDASRIGKGAGNVEPIKPGLLSFAPGGAPKGDVPSWMPQDYGPPMPAGLKSPTKGKVPSGPASPLPPPMLRSLADVLDGPGRPPMPAGPVDYPAPPVVPAVPIVAATTMPFGRFTNRPTERRGVNSDMPPYRGDGTDPSIGGARTAGAASMGPFGMGPLNEAASELRLAASAFTAKLEGLADANRAAPIRPTEDMSGEILRRWPAQTIEQASAASGADRNTPPLPNPMPVSLPTGFKLDGMPPSDRLERAGPPPPVMPFSLPRPDVGPAFPNPMPVSLPTGFRLAGPDTLAASPPMPQFPNPMPVSFPGGFPAGGAPDLASFNAAVDRMSAAMPSGPLEARIVPDQVHATLDGRVPVDVTGRLEPVQLQGSAVVNVMVAPSSALIAAAATVQAQGHLSAGNTGVSMPHVAGE